MRTWNLGWIISSHVPLGELRSYNLHVTMNANKINSSQSVSVEKRKRRNVRNREKGVAAKVLFYRVRRHAQEDRQILRDAAPAVHLALSEPHQKKALILQKILQKTKPPSLHFRGYLGGIISYWLVVFKAQLGEPFLGILIFVFSSCFHCFHPFFFSFWKLSLKTAKNRHFSSQTGTLKRYQKDQKRHLRALTGT